MKHQIQNCLKVAVAERKFYVYVCVWESVIKDHADSLKPYTEYLTLGLINIQWNCHGWMDRNYLQSTEDVCSGGDHTGS